MEYGNNDNRFETVYKKPVDGGFLEQSKVLTILRDRETGVHYLFAHAGYAGGLTVLLDKDGKPVIE